VSEADAGRFEVGQRIGVADLFHTGDRVDVSGRSKGRGFAGVIKRHRFNSFVAGHGTHEYFRHSGSIGQNMQPGRVFAGLRMPGHMGDVRVTQVGLRVAGVDAERDLVLIDGSVPGFRTAFVTVRLSDRKTAAPAVAATPGAKKK
jgi:large subunit ribosomal protein L3